MAGSPGNRLALRLGTWQRACVSLCIMAADNIEGERKEVDYLIKELASKKTAASKPAAPPMTIPGAKSVARPAPVPQIAAPGPRATTRVAAPVTTSKTFVSAIRLRPAMKSMGVSLEGFSLPSLPSLRSLPSLQGISVPAFSEVTTVRAWVGLGAALAVAMPFWPYAKPYSWGLLFYMFAVAMLIVTGVWSARLTWITRLAVAHTLALTIVFWGLTLATVETLPRIGYAKAEATWFHP